MRLTETERWILSNQYHILAALHPDEAQSYEFAARALEDGYEGAYSWYNSVNPEVLSEEECSEVEDILMMFLVLKRAYEEMEDKPNIDQKDITFMGFDGNNDKQYSFCQFLADRDRWTELNIRLNNRY